MHVADTLTTSMHIVFPQHTNSHGIIFGGNTMCWSEEVAIMACRTMRIGSSRAPSWKTVSMDGLEFNVQVGVGECVWTTGNGRGLRVCILTMDNFS